MKTKKRTKDAKSVESGSRNIRKSLDKLWSENIRFRDKKCIHCGSTFRIAAHHIFSRRYSSVRWDLDNGVSLCYPCHIHWAHSKYEEFRDWVIELIGDKYEDLKRRAYEIKKFSPTELKILKKELESGGL